MRIDRLLERCDARGDATCLIEDGRAVSFEELKELRLDWRHTFERENISAGTVVGVRSGFSAGGISLLLALFERRCVVALLPADQEPAVYLREAQVELAFDVADDGAWSARRIEGRVDQALLLRLRAEGGAGVVIFTSGSTGRPKAALHSVEGFLSKFDREGKPLRTLAFLLFDHIAGLDTLCYTLAAGGTLVLPDSLRPRAIAALIERHGVEVLPASPTFLNLLCVSGAGADFDLSSLRIITYGSEPMSEATLQRIGALVPHARLIQKYGTTEFGAPRAQSRARDSLWLQLKGDETDARVEDGVLWVRSPAAMLGYLNAPDPFDGDGWICTGDAVQVDGDWIRVLGRKSETINVGGEKVYPGEVEAAILELAFVEDVVVRGEQNPLTGSIVTAELTLAEPMDEKQAGIAVRKHCRKTLARHKVPVRVTVSDTSLVSARQKKLR